MRKSNLKMTTRTLAYCALFAALSIVLARLMGLMPNPSTRFSLESIPVFMAGMLLGPVPGALVGFVADFVGCLFSAFGYNPIFCIPPILYGLFGGLFRYFLSKKLSVFRLTTAFLVPVVLGSLLYQSATLAFIYYEGAFIPGFIYYLSTRAVQFAITLVINVTVIRLLFQTGIFRRANLWPVERIEKNECK